MEPRINYLKVEGEINFSSLLSVGIFSEKNSRHCKMDSAEVKTFRIRDRLQFEAGLVVKRRQLNHRSLTNASGCFARNVERKNPVLKNNVRSQREK